MPLAPRLRAARADAAIGSIRGPREIAFNVAVGKTFLVADRLKLDFRVEAFNVANHPNLLNVNTAFNPTNTTTFGQAYGGRSPHPGGHASRELLESLW